MDHKKNQKRNNLLFHFQGSVKAIVFLMVCMFIGQNKLYAQDNMKTTEQQITVKGYVIDETNYPVIGASISVIGMKNKTITDVNGNFTITCTSNSSINVSYIGYVTQQFKATDDLMHIKLKEDAAKLDEVVVVGYGQVKRSNLTGAVTSVSMKDLADYPSANLASVLNGVMPGVHVSEPTGNPVGGASISVRINASWTGGDPLYVIDGFIRDVDAFNRLDPSEVESVSVLKDASASVYGVRGRDGVVLVKTKMGKVGKPKVSYAMSF